MLAAALPYPPNERFLVIILMSSPHMGYKYKSVDVFSVATQIDPITSILA
jgi:hypothetical protein